jgi:hypothetical protein
MENLLTFDPIYQPAPTGFIMSAFSDALLPAVSEGDEGNTGEDNEHGK